MALLALLQLFEALPCWLRCHNLHLQILLSGVVHTAVPQACTALLRFAGSLVVLVADPPLLLQVTARLNPPFQVVLDLLVFLKSAQLNVFWMSRSSLLYLD
jgi:uncharacterized membrane protein YhfC